MCGVAIYCLPKDQALFLNPMERGTSSNEVIQSKMDRASLTNALRQAFDMSKRVRAGDGNPMKKVLKVRSEKEVVRRTHLVTAYKSSGVYSVVRWVRAPRYFGFDAEEGFEMPDEFSSIDDLVDNIIGYFDRLGL